MSSAVGQQDKDIEDVKNLQHLGCSDTRSFTDMLPMPALWFCVSPLVTLSRMRSRGHARARAGGGGLSIRRRSEPLPDQDRIPVRVFAQECKGRVARAAKERGWSTVSEEGRKEVSQQQKEDERGVAGAMGPGCCQVPHRSDKSQTPQQHGPRSATTCSR